MSGKISFTLDIWTSPNQFSFLRITGHWIDKNWILQSILIDFQPLQDIHSGSNLAEAFIISCNNMGILTKVNIYIIFISFYFVLF